MHLVQATAWKKFIRFNLRFFFLRWKQIKMSFSLKKINNIFELYDIKQKFVGIVQHDYIHDSVRPDILM